MPDAFAYWSYAVRTSQTAYFCLNRSSTWPTWISLGKPALNVGGGSKRTFGNMNRPVAVSAASIDAVKAVHAKVIQERKERRGMGGFAAGAAGFAGAGFGGAGGEAVVVSSLLIQDSQD
jgi:hypothetical protein